MKSNLDDLNDFSMLYSQYPKHDDPMIQGFMTKVRLGGLFPCKRTNHMYDDQEFCPFCGQEDSMYHRVYKCVGTEHIRQGPIWKEVEHFPMSLMLGGLSGPPSGLQSFRQHLDSLPHPEVYKLPQTQEPRTFFTDGSAFGCGDIQALLCSWAVTEATYMTKANVVRCSGLLPGRKQTVFRSELHAINVAIAMSDSAIIYADNESAVKRAQQIIAGSLADTTLAQHPDRDLLQTTISLIRQRRVLLRFSGSRHTDQCLRRLETLMSGLFITTSEQILQPRQQAAIYLCQSFNLRNYCFLKSSNCWMLGAKLRLYYVR